MENDTHGGDLEVRDRSDWKFPDILKRMIPALSSVGLLLGVFVPFYTMQSDRFNSIETNQAQTKIEILEALSKNDDASEKRIDYILKKSLNDDIQILESRSEKERTDVEEHLLSTFEREYTSL